MPKILSIEIDNKYIKVIEASRKINGELLSINKFFSLSIPSGCIIDGKIINIDFLLAEIKRALLEHDVKARKVIFVISPNLVIMRKIKLPILKRKSQTLSMIKLEFEQLIATNLKQVIIYRKVDTANIVYDTANNIEDKPITESKYLVYGLSYNTYNQYIELSKMLNVKPIALVTSSNCLEKISQNNFMINGKDYFSGTTAFVKILYDYIVFCVIKDKINDFSRIIDLNLDKMELYESDKVAESADDVNYKTDRYRNEIDFDENLCIDEINKNIRYYNTMDKDNIIEKIYIYSDCKESKINVSELNLSLVTNKDVEFIKEVDIILNSKIDIEYPESGFDKINYLNGFLSLFNSNINDINFLGDKIKKRKKRIVICILVITTILFAIIIIIFYSNSYIINNELMNADMVSMDLFINKKNNIEINNKAEKLKNEVAFLEEYKKESMKLKKIINSEDTVSSGVLREIQYVIPKGTDVISIIMSRNSIQMQCRAFSVQEIILFLSSLRGISSISNVYIPLIKHNDSDDYNFSYSVICKLEDVIFDEIE